MPLLLYIINFNKGKTPTDQYVTEMLNEAGPGSENGQLNFTMFLTLFGVKMNGTDSEDVIRNALTIFDENGTGQISEDKFRDLITTIGDRYTIDEVEQMLRDVDIKDGMINCNEFSHLLKHGKKET